ncbi:Peptidyl-prolyl cis-trans isomerase CYP40 [Gossypium australe]|uniref:Peptidyl-prolyl cis-trans isomerase CYP40 n=1 Tax=Gossypium australe TaxID=47621 RepID=A0A5B6UY97_9ROSI|nr:Peptidyl-prolyl cis-trans isomerase CYP40 [Gossypium australe]
MIFDVKSSFPSFFAIIRSTASSKSCRIWGLFILSHVFCRSGGIKKELAAARKKIADRRDQEKKAYSRISDILFRAGTSCPDLLPPLVSFLHLQPSCGLPFSSFCAASAVAFCSIATATRQFANDVSSLALLFRA